MKELEDRRWFPPTLRNFQVEFIGFVVVTFHVYDPFIKYLKELSLPEQTMMDLCSGSGEPAISIFKKSDRFNSLILTDKYPDKLEIHDEKIFYETQSKDVQHMEFKHGMCYTMYNALHHFEDEDKLALVKKIQEADARAFFVEIIEPQLIYFLKVVIMTTIGTILFTPFVKPFSLKRLLFTYIIPINIITIAYDGIISVLKSSSEKQYQKLFVSYGKTIKVFRMTKGISPLVVIQIQPKHESAHNTLEFQQASHTHRQHN